MIKSMTGYGRSEITKDQRKITVEMKSVNNRFLDVNIKMPKKLNFFEANIRNELKKYIGRGKVDMFITYEDMTESNLCVKYNQEIAKEYLTHLQTMAEQFNLQNDIKVSTLSRYPEVFTMEEQVVDEDALWQILKEAVDEACEGFLKERIREGEFLRNDLISKLDGMLEGVDFISEKAPGIVQTYKDRLYAKVRDLLEDSSIDDARILQEVTMYADKVCVDEELVRLRSHIEATKQALSMEEGVGRKLDFLAQEMNREANTILSKSDDMEVSAKAITLKTEIEKVREQIQNIE